MTSNTSNHTFQVNLGGVLDVLANHLYSSEQVFVRELLQNACDAIAARQLKMPDWKGEINIELITENETPLLVIEDNGVGLTESEVKEFLSSIGASAKRDYFTNNREQFIGQFGIGLLACFMVCENITLITQSDRNDAIKWVGKIDGTYEMSILNKKLSTGTKVYIAAKKEKITLFNSKNILRLLKKYGEILPFPIYFAIDGGERQLINTQKAVWEQQVNSGANRLEILDYGSTTFDIPFNDYIPIDIVEKGVKGVAYIYPFSINPNAKHAHKVFLKRMLLSEEADNVVSDWCFFVKCVLNVNHLRPTASRESFYEDDDLEELRHSIGKVIRTYLIGLSQNDNQKLSKILAIHENAFKQLALSDDDFFEMIIPFLRFRTTKGDMMLKEIDESVIRHVPDVDEFRKITPIANAKGITIVNSGYMYDAALLRKYGALNHDKNVENIDINSFIEIFEELDLQEQAEIEHFMPIAKAVLSKYKCKPEVKKFNPSNLSTLYYMSQSVERDRLLKNTMETSDALWGDILSTFVEDFGTSNYSILCFNYKNQVVKRLVKIVDEELLKSVLSILYTNALMLGHHPISTKEMNDFNLKILDLVDWVAQNKNI